jgi:hypothetical protein
MTASARARCWTKSSTHTNADMLATESGGQSLALACCVCGETGALGVSEERSRASGCRLTFAATGGSGRGCRRVCRSSPRPEAVRAWRGCAGSSKATKSRWSRAGPASSSAPAVGEQGRSGGMGSGARLPAGKEAAATASRRRAGSKDRTRRGMEGPAAMRVAGGSGGEASGLWRRGIRGFRRQG